MLTVGKYKTRNGRDVKIVAIEDGVAIGYFVGVGVADGLSTWTAKNGRFWDDWNVEDCNDIIDTRPRIKREVWLSVYKQEFFGVVAGLGYSTKKQATQEMKEGCIAIARVEIDCVEGENLD